MNAHLAPEDLISRLRQAGLHDPGVRHFDEGGTTAAMGGGFGDSGTSQSDSSGMDAALAAAAPAAQATATNGMTMGELSALASMGGGNMAISDTQTVDNAIASLNTASTLASINPSSIAGMVAGPLAGMAVSAISNITAGVNSGMSFAEAVASIGQSMALSTAIGVVAQGLGLPSSVVTGVVNGNIGNALSGSATTGVVSAVASAMGIPSSAAATIGNITGLTAATNSAISSSINSNQSVAALNSAISGVTAGMGGGLHSAGAGGTSGSSDTADAGNVSGGVGGPNAIASSHATDATSMPTPVAAAQRPSPTYTAMGTPQELPAEAYTLVPYDPFGESIFQNQRYPKPTSGSLKSAYNIPPSLRAAEGGSIDDLMDYLRN